MERVIKILSSKKFDLHNEKILQQQIESCLNKEGINFKREVELSKRDKIDFIVNIDGQKIGLEIKIDGNAKSIYKQLQRYCLHDIDAIILATNKTVGLPEQINNKPTSIVKLGRAWL